MNTTGPAVSPPVLPFVGRADERDRLERALSSRSGTIVVCGAGGVGKTRLVRETMHDLDIRSLEARPRHDDPHLSLFAAVVAECRRVTGVEHLDDLVAQPERLAPLVSDGSWEARDTPDVVHSLVVGLLRLVEATRRRIDRPTALVLDDLHRSSTLTLEIVQGMVHQRRQFPLVLVTRPDADDAIAPALDGTLAVRPRIELAPLTVDEVIALHAAVGQDEHRAMVTMGRTQGLPLAVRSELLGLDAAATSEQGDRVLAAWAILGEHADPWLTAEVAETDLETVTERIDEAILQGILDVDPSGLAHFHHDDLRAGALESVDSSTAQQMHRRALDGLTARHGDAPRWLAARADHAVAAGPAVDPRRVVDLALAASTHLRLRGDLGGALARADDAATALDRAAAGAERATAQTTGPAPVDVATRRLDVELERVSALVALGNADSRPALSDLLEAALASGRTDIFRQAALMMPTSQGAVALQPRGDTVAVDLLRQALDLAGPAPTLDRARLLIEFAMQQHADASPHDFHGWLDEAAEILERHDDPGLVVELMGARFGIRRSPGEAGDLLERIPTMRETIAADAPGRLVLAALELTCRWRLGHIDEGLAAARASLAEIDHLPPFWAWSFGRWQAARSLACGEIEAAEIEAVQAFEAVAGTRWEPAAAEYLNYQLGIVIRERCEFHSALAVFENYLANEPDSRIYRGGTGWILADLGRRDDAIATLAPLFDLDWSRLEGSAEWIPFIANLTAAAATVERADWCRRCVDALAPWRDEWAVWGSGTVIDGPIALRRALAAAVAGDFETAHDDLERASDGIRLAGAELYRPLLERTRGDVARLADRPAEALDHYEAAVRRYHALDLEAQARRVEATVRAHGLRAARPSRLRRSTDCWVIESPEGKCELAYTRGMRFLVPLLTRPGESRHVLELTGAVDGLAGGPGTSPADEVSPGGHVEPLLDRQAITAFRARLRELETRNDTAAVEERMAIEAELSSSLRPDGRSRAMTDDAERARVRVRKAIGRAIEHVRAESPGLARHLESSIQTGFHCVYVPSDGRRWDVT